LTPQFGSVRDDDIGAVTLQRPGLAEALDAGAEKHGASRRMTGARFGHEFLLDERVR